MDKQIEIQSFNPYESRFPNRKLIDRDTLKLIKVLRNEGYNVVVRPSNDIPVQYLFRKGIAELFSNPVYAFLIGLPTGIITNIISNYIQKYLDHKKTEQTPINIYNNIFIGDVAKKTTINLNGKAISVSELRDLEKKQLATKKKFASSLSLTSPYSHLPTPIFLEHTPKLVGWCKTEITDVGMRIEDSRILDKNVFRKIKQGKIKGASMTGIAEKSSCSICKQSYVECNHIAGYIYEGLMCGNYIEQSTTIELSLVKAPINSQCIINIKEQEQ